MPCVGSWVYDALDLHVPGVTGADFLVGRVERESAGITDRRQTPGNSQNRRSAPQKQPSPNNASPRPSGDGGARRLQFTWWRSGTRIGGVLPGRAVSAVGNVVLRPMRL